MGSANSEIEKYLKNFIIEYNQYTEKRFGFLSKEEQLLFLYSYYHYFNADASEFDEINKGNVWEPMVADHISGIYIDEDSDDEDINAIIVSYVEDRESFPFPAILKFYKDAEDSLLETKKSRQKLSSYFEMNEECKISSSKHLVIRVITNYVPKVNEKRLINKAISTNKPDNPNVSYSISFGDELVFEILEIENPKEYVDHATLVIDKPNNYARYGSEDSLIVNLSAKSLKQIYVMYGYRGLFAQNLRYYVKNSKIDDKIVDSIQNHPENFWYYNNGIIIICSDYIVDNQHISIDEFSIINGGQTTKLIGETDFDSDFFIPCKIIKNMFTSDEDKRLDFISNVAEASNTQKPIKDKDLIANKTEQRLLKRQLAEAGVYCQIKRGEKVNKKIYPEAWQNTTNEELGQFILSFLYQLPGTARGNKASICRNEERYNLVFSKKYCSGMLVDLLKLKAFYKLWMVHVKKTDTGDDQYKVGLVNNGMFFTIAIIGVLTKFYYHKELIDQVVFSVVSEQKLEVLSQFDIDHPFIKEGALSKELFFSLFEYCYSHFYRPGFEFFKEFRPNFSGYSNFTKMNSSYTTCVVKMIELEFKNGIPPEDNSFLSSVLYKESKEDIDHDVSLRSQYVNVISELINPNPNLSESDIEKIKDALKNYRTKTFRINRIKAYEVFKNKALDRIAQFAPSTLEELKNLKCLDSVQLELYGQSIVDIVVSSLNSN